MLEFLSLEDDLVQKYLKPRIRRTFQSLRREKQKDEDGTAALPPEPRATPMVDGFIRSVIRRCQRRSEKDTFRQREAVLRADEERAKSLGFTSSG